MKIDIQGYVPKTECMAAGCSSSADWKLDVQRGKEYLGFVLSLCDEHDRLASRNGGITTGGPSS